MTASASPQPLRFTLRVTRLERSDEGLAERSAWAAQVDGALRRAGLEDSVAPGPGWPHHAEVLHVAARGPEAEARALAALEGCPELLARGPLVLMEVWDPGGKGEHSLRRLATRALRAGAPACLVPRQPPRFDLWGGWMEGFYRALARGQTLREAMGQGEAVARVRGAEPRSFALVRPQGWPGLEAPLVERAWRPEGWPRPAPEAEGLLQRTFEAAARRGGTHVGAEHLIEALLGLKGDARVAPLQARGRALLPELRAGLAELTAARSGPPDWRGTPRLRRAGRGLEAGFGPGPLLGAVSGLLAELELAWFPTSSRERSPARALEVLGGPEDGRRIAPGPGEELGREAEHSLYAGSARSDPRLKRRHLRWLGEGRVQLARTVAVRVGDARHHLGPGEATLQAGDLLELTRCTRLLGST